MDQENTQPNLGTIFRNILLIFLATALPSAELSFFAWLHPLLPLLVFYFLVKHGMRIGSRFILTGVILASVLVGMVFGRLESILFTLTLLPTGYILADSVYRQDSPPVAGLKGALTLTACWLLFLGGATLISGTSPYTLLMQAIDSGVDEALIYYRQNDTVAPETLEVLEATLYRMKVVLPVIMPAILLSFTLLITWFTMVMGNILVRVTCAKAAWPSYRTWQLPDRLIWLGIFFGLLAFLPDPKLRFVSVNVLILLSIIYCFQGLAIFVYFMNKWNVPLLFRSFFYVMIIFQSFGTALLLILGVADTWFDWRKFSQPETEDDQDTKE